MNNRVPPHSDDLERAVLCSMLIDDKAAYKAIDKQLEPQDFYSRAHQRICEAIQSLYNNGFTFGGKDTMMALKNELKKTDKLDEAGGENYIDGLLTAAPSSANADYYIHCVMDYSLRRRIMYELSNAQRVHDESLDAMEVLEKTIDSLVELKKRFAVDGGVKLN